MRRTRKISNSTSSLPKSTNPRHHHAKDFALGHLQMKEASSVSNLLKKNSKLFDREQSASAIPSIPKFLPKNRYYVQLSPAKNEYDLKGKSIEQDLKSFEKLLNNHSLAKKASDLNIQLKSFKLKSARFSLMKRILQHYPLLLPT